MLKYLTTFFLVFFLVFAPVVANSSEDAQVQALSSTQMAREVVVKLVSQNPRIGSTCSAVVIAENKALTAAHCLSIPNKAIKYDDGRIFPVRIALPDIMGRDMATLFVPGLVGPTAITTTARIEEDELVYAVGYPYGFGNVLTVGNFQFRIYDPLEDKYYLMSTVMIAPGNSGGALFVVRDGIPYLVGIVVAYVGSQYLAVAVELP